MTKQVRFKCDITMQSGLKRGDVEPFMVGTEADDVGKYHCVDTDFPRVLKELNRTVVLIRGVSIQNGYPEATDEIIAYGFKKMYGNSKNPPEALTKHPIRELDGESIEFIERVEEKLESGDIE